MSYNLKSIEYLNNISITANKLLSLSNQKEAETLPAIKFYRPLKSRMK